MILKRIKEKCLEKGLTISALEKQAGIGNGTIARWNTSSPTVESIQAVAKVLNCTVDDLLRADEKDVQQEVDSGRL